mgnify:CR=1 FL=1
MDDNNLRTLGLIQQTRSKNLDHNLESSIQEIRKSAEQGAQIICLQELFRSQYFCQTEESNEFNLAETIPGPSTKVLSTALVFQGIHRRCCGLPKSHSRC